jgi:hypothetical protein
MRYEETPRGRGVIDSLNNIDEDLAGIRQAISDASVAYRNSGETGYGPGRTYLIDKIDAAVSQAINDVRKEVRRDDS